MTTSRWLVHSVWFEWGQRSIHVEFPMRRCLKYRSPQFGLFVSSRDGQQWKGLGHKVVRQTFWSPQVFDVRDQNQFKLVGESLTDRIVIFLSRDEGSIIVRFWSRIFWLLSVTLLIFPTDDVVYYLFSVFDPWFEMSIWSIIDVEVGERFHLNVQF